MRSPTLLEMQGITKKFPGVVALEDVQLSLRPGEVLALMGENGAGKSTLMKVLGGAYAPEAGRILINGEEVTLRGIEDAKAQGIALIHQELMLAPNLDIASNIFLGSEQPSTGLLRKLNSREMNRRATELTARVGLSLPPTTRVSELTAGQKQMVEIAKALSVNARIIIMDEPTSSLGAAESEQLFKIIRQLRDESIGIVYISHRMEEVVRLSDRIMVLRDGRYIGDLSRAEASHDKIVAMMVGRELSNEYFPAREGRSQGQAVLEVDSVVVPGAPQGVSFTAFAGEILGFAGLVGAGRTELMQTLFGVEPALLGSMRLLGAAYSPRAPRDAIRSGVYLAPEDRKRHGLVLPLSIAENTSLPDVASYAKFGWLDRSRENKVAQEEATRLRTKASSVSQLTVNLSGGNQQKVVLGKWLAMSPKVLILDEPTRGIDVGAKAEIYRHMAELAKAGIAILMVSSDMEEVLGMSDRVVVMRERRIMGVLSGDELTQHSIARLMTGVDSLPGAETEAIA